MLSIAFTQTVRKLKPILYHNQCNMFIKQKAKTHTTHPPENERPPPKTVLISRQPACDLTWAVVFKLRLNFITDELSGTV